MTVAAPTEIYGFSFNNQLFGGAGQGIQVLSINGMDDLPDVRSQDDNRGYQDGMFSGRDFLSGRTIVMKLQIMTTAGVPMQTYLDQLKYALTIQQQGTTPLYFLMSNSVNSTNPTGVRYVNARVRHRKITIDPNYSYGRAEADVEFFCPDPRFYDYENTSAPFILGPTVNTGRVYPRVYPLLYSTSIGFTNSINIYNNGNATTYPVFGISGICDTPSIIDTTTGNVLTFNVALDTGDMLIVDTDLRTITLNDVNARNLLANGSTWFALPSAGVTGSVYTTLVFSTLSYGAGVALYIDYRNAYI